MMKTGQPQLEHGYTRIANELLEALIRYPFNGGEYKILLAIIRLTYGWRRREWAIAQQGLVQATGVSLRQVKRTLTHLREQGVLWRDRTTRPFTYQLNKAYQGWRDWPAQEVGDFCVTLYRRACELSLSGGRHVTVAGDTSVPPLFIKEKKEKKEYAAESRETVHNSLVVDNLLRSFRQFLNRPLTTEEQWLVAHLYELSPTQAQQLLTQVASQVSSPTPTGGGTHAAGLLDSHG